MIPTWQRKIAKERIQILFRLADREFSAHPERSHRYVELARKIGMKYKVRVPTRHKRKFCTYCYKYFRAGVNLKVRLSKKMALYICGECGRVKRYPIRTK